MTRTAAHLFIPAPTGAQLASFHWADGPELRPLLGWLLDPNEREGDPVVIGRRGVAEVLTPTTPYHRLSTMTPDEPRDQFTAWADDARRELATACANIRPRILASLRNHGRAFLRTAAGYQVAHDLTAEGVAEWADTCADRLDAITPEDTATARP